MTTSTLPSNWPTKVRSALLQVVSLAHAAIVHSRSWCADSPIRRVQLQGKLNGAESEIALLREELHIKDAPMGKIPAHHRPFYPPAERLAILELKAARGWNLAQTAKTFLVEPETIAEWLTRLDEDRDHALIRLPETINKYPSFVRHVVQRLKTLCPTMGKKRIADTLARAGLRLATTTVGRMLKAKPSPPVEPVNDEGASDECERTVTARYPNHVWHVDLTVVPTHAGFWVPWFPFTLLQVWPFCWWVAVIVDHFSRQCMGFAVFKKQPSSLDIRSFMGRAIRLAGRSPRHLISDRGPQFDCEGFRTWCRRKGIKWRYGAVGKYGSIAIVERFIRSMKSECTRRILAPIRLSDMREELALYVVWFNTFRPHQGLAGTTPKEMADDIVALEPPIETRGKTGVRLKLVVSHMQGRKHLPIVELKKVA